MTSDWLTAKIIVALPKLTATQVDALLEELRDQDATIARTILNVALDAAEPAGAAQRYVREFYRVVAQLKTLDPSIARTIANATSADLRFSATTQFDVGLDDVRVDLSPTSAPEPASLTMLSLGAVTLLGCAWRRRRTKATQAAA